METLSRTGEWPTKRWDEALQEWAKEPEQSWSRISTVLNDAPDDILGELAHSLGRWLQAIAESLKGEVNPVFFNLIGRVLRVEQDKAEQKDDDTDKTERDHVLRAINHPVGIVTKAALLWWYQQSLEDGQGLPTKIRSLFTNLCDRQIIRFRHGRVVLAEALVTLFRVDRDWTEQHLLPLFHWRQADAEPRAVWQGCLYSLQPFWPLLEAIKQPFLSAAEHYTELGKARERYAALLTFTALADNTPFSYRELATAMRSLPQQGLRSAAQALVSAIDGSGTQRKEYWQNRVLPYLRSVWPKSKDKVDSSTSEQFARLCVAAGEAFPEAFDYLKPWLQPIKHPDNIVHLLHQAEHPANYPDAALGFLNTVIDDHRQWPPGDLKKCLQEIETARPAIKKDQKFRRLEDYLREHRSR
ncbi:MAG: hypothetical protein HQL88_00450 [Magnetococcales bacterium]|nr:hypothetical protein [Magnetococcales bacterium]